MSILDPIKIANKYAIFSNQPNDLLFNKSVFDKPLFCAGILKDIGNEIYNYKVGSLLGYISPNIDIELEISANLTVKFPNEENHKLIFILPYALHAMNIMRKISPKLGETILIFGNNFFHTLLKKILEISGAEVFLSSTNDLDRMTLNLNTALISPEVQKKPEFIKDFKIERKFDINQFKIYDMGLNDSMYKKGVKYPYSYIRWQYKTNLHYFIDLVLKNKIRLDFFQLKEKSLSSINELSEHVESLKENSLALFNLQL